MLKRSSDLDQILQAIRGLGLAEAVSGGEVPLDRDGRKVGLVVNLSVGVPDLERSADELLRLVQSRCSAIAELLRGRNLPYGKYCFQFVKPIGSGILKIYFANYSKAFRVIHESSHVDIIAKLLRDGEKASGTVIDGR